MVPNRKVPNRMVWGWSLLLLWLLTSVVVMFRFGQSEYGEFDPDLQLKQHPQQFSALSLLGNAEPGATVLIHVQDPNCRCTRLANQHLQALAAQLATLPSLYQRTFHPAELTALGIAVPATPMLIVIRNQQLVYSGPYASGPNCSVDDSLLAEIIAQKMHMPGVWLNSETAACRCLTTTAS